jgi:uncharacterized coiled-coil DUF342 family protein
MNNTPTPRTDADERMAWNAEYMVPPETARKLERELTAMTEQRDRLRKRIAELEEDWNEARDALSKISLYLSVGMGDNSTTAHQYYERIIEGIQMLTRPIMQMLEKAREQRDELAEVLQDIYNYAKGKKPHDYHNLIGSSDQLTAKFDAWQEIESKIEELLQTTPTPTQTEPK